jgi:carboxymethylenebutenolidase
MSDKISRREVIGATALTGAALLTKNAGAQAPQNNPTPPATPTLPPGRAEAGATIGKDVTFGSGDAQIKAYFAQPAKGTPKGGIVVIHEIWGLNEHIRDVTRRFAAQGYYAIAPDFFSREGAPQLDPQKRDELMKFIASIPDRRVVADGEAALNYLKQNGAQKLGVTGFCMGGLYSYLLAAKSTQLSAAAGFYGRIVYAEKTENKPESPIDLAPTLKCPFLGLYGETDGSIPVAHVEQLKEKLKGSAQPWKINIYPGAGHAFFNDTRPSFNPGAAKDAWAEVTAFFAKYLG